MQEFVNTLYIIRIYWGTKRRQENYENEYEVKHYGSTYNKKHINAHM